MFSSKGPAGGGLVTSVASTQGEVLLLVTTSVASTGPSGKFMLLLHSITFKVASSLFKYSESVSCSL
jgi:hypothetical protein